MIDKDPMIPHVSELDKTPLIDTQYKIAKIDCEFDTNSTIGKNRNTLIKMMI